MAKKIKNYLQNREDKLKRKEPWAAIDWSGGTINHNHQVDSSSCGVFVLKVR